MSKDAREIKFWDGSKRRNWFWMRATVRKVMDEPEILLEVAEWMDRHWADDPSQQRNLRNWRRVVNLPPREFARAVLADTEISQETRESAPFFMVLTDEEMAEFLAAARTEPAIAYNPDNTEKP